MKKLILILYIIINSLILFSCSNKKSLVIYNFGEYLMPELKDKFYKKTGISIKEITYDSSQIAETSIRSKNQYDILIASEFSIDNLRNEKIADNFILEKIDWSKIKIPKTTSFAITLQDVLTKLDSSIGYSILDYAIPYGWGSFGILYNSDRVSDEKIIEQEWSIIKNKELNFKRAIYDSPVEITSVALKALGIKVENATEEDIKKAEEWLLDIPNKKQTKFITDAIFDDIPRGDVDLVFVISGEAGEIINRTIEKKQNINLKYYVPKNQGSNIWLDAISIPYNSKKDYAYEFINFILEEENASQNADYLGFCSPLDVVYKNQVKAAKEEIDEEEDQNKKNKLIQVYNTLNIINNDKNEIFLFKPDIRKIVDETWIKFKANVSIKGWWGK